MPVLGIDVGTSGSRAIVVGHDGALLSSATRDHEPFASPGPAWAEQHPADWWRAAQEATRAAIAASGLASSEISCVGLSGQMHGAVLLDEHGEVVRPAIIWCDQRTDDECALLNRTIGAQRILELTCNPALPNFTLTKLLWVRDHEPHLWARVRHVLLPKDYVRYCLSGEFAIDVADAEIDPSASTTTAREPLVPTSRPMTEMGTLLLAGRKSIRATDTTRHRHHRHHRPHRM